MDHRMTIALDGPAGAGKSTIARLLARRLNILYLDTGAMYRAVGLKAIRSDVSVRDEMAVAAMLEHTVLEIVFQDTSQHVLLDGEDVSDAIRTPEASIAASDVSALPAVRLALVRMQREIAARQPLILDGRDIGSYVLPDAPYKFFLTADPAERARRRLLDLQARGDQTTTFAQVLQDIEYRDRQDSSRSLAPLCQAADAILIDTTHL
ncbi:MAG TPA: (d)CMP kinase, partial [Clostridiales bacterium]|nr:(d)CMP kinase [Clostridiales bacterium]